VRSSLFPTLNSSVLPPSSRQSQRALPKACFAHRLPHDKDFLRRPAFARAPLVIAWRRKGLPSPPLRSILRKAVIPGQGPVWEGAEDFFPELTSFPELVPRSSAPPELHRGSFSPFLLLRSAGILCHFVGVAESLIAEWGFPSLC